MNSSSVGPSPARRPRGRPRDGVDDGEQVVAVHGLGGHAVADAAVRQPRAGVLLAHRRRQAVLVVLDDEEHGQLPHGRQVHRLVEVAFRGPAVAAEHRGHARFALELKGQRHAVGHRQHRPQVADHPDDVVLGRAEMKRPIAAAGVAAVAAQQLAEERAQVEPAAGEDAEIAMERQNRVVGPQRRRHAHRDGLLPDAREPLRQPSLPQQDQHLLLDQARKQQGAIQIALSLRIDWAIDRR